MMEVAWSSQVEVCSVLERLIATTILDHHYLITWAEAAERTNETSHIVSCVVVDCEKRCPSVSDSGNTSEPRVLGYQLVR